MDRLGPLNAFLQAAEHRSFTAAGRKPGYDGTFGQADRPPIAPLIRQAFKGPLILNTDYDRAKAQRVLDEDQADAIGFGRPYLANPDLPYRFANDIPLTPDDMATWYSRGAAGYLDYPAANEASALAPTG